MTAGHEQHAVINDCAGVEKLDFLGGGSGRVNIRGRRRIKIHSLESYEEDAFILPRMDV